MVKEVEEEEDGCSHQQARRFPAAAVCCRRRCRRRRLQLSFDTRTGEQLLVPAAHVPPKILEASDAEIAQLPGRKNRAEEKVEKWLITCEFEAGGFGFPGNSIPSPSLRHTSKAHEVCTRRHVHAQTHTSLL